MRISIMPALLGSSSRGCAYNLEIVSVQYMRGETRTARPTMTSTAAKMSELKITLLYDSKNLIYGRLRRSVAAAYGSCKNSWICHHWKDVAPRYSLYRGIQ